MTNPTTTTPSIPSIGDRKLSLATHLRAAVNLLLDEANTTYNWAHFGQCNCGVIARCVTGLEADAIQGVMTFHGGLPVGEKQCNIGWSGSIPRHIEHCRVTGAPVHVIVAQLMEAGMLVEDLDHVEWLSHPELMSPHWEVGNARRFADRVTKTAHFQQRKNAAFYLLAWSRAIEAFHATNVPQSSDTIVIQVPGTNAQSVLACHHG